MEVSSAWIDLLSRASPLSMLDSGLVRVSECIPVDQKSVPVSTNVSYKESLEASKKLEDQEELISKLMSDNATLILQMESLLTATNQEQKLKAKEQVIQGLMAHINNLREEFTILISQFKSPPRTTSLLEDLERLTFKNADLCNALAATQCSRNVLEREIIVLKRALLDERSKVFESVSNHPQFNEIIEENRKLQEKLDELELERTENIQLKQQIENLRLGQLKEIDQRCKEVDALKQQLSEQLNSLQKDRDTLSCKLTELTRENKCLLNKVSSLEETNLCLATKLSEATEKLQLESTVLNSHFALLSNQLQSENSTLQSQLSFLRRYIETEVEKDNEQYSNHKLRAVLLELESIRNYNCTYKKQTDAAVCVQGTNAMSNHSFSHQTDVFLKQHLADSRQFCVRLEFQLAQLKTENAKLSGSYQAMVSIRDQLSQEIMKCRCENRDLQSEKELLFKEKEACLSQLGDLSANTLKLESDLAAVKNELHGISSVSYRGEGQLRSQIQVTEEYNEDVSELTARASILHTELDDLYAMIDTEIYNSDTLSHECDDALSCKQQELLDTLENIKINGTINSMRLCQIEMCDESIVRLQGELDVLRARKTVLLFTSQQGISAYPAVSSSAASHEGTRLKRKLKRQSKQINFLRVKLGYTLSELRLYKQLKDACDQQLSELENCLGEVQKRYQLCAMKLATAEEQLDMYRAQSSVH